MPLWTPTILIFWAGVVLLLVNLSFRVLTNYYKEISRAWKMIGTLYGLGEAPPDLNFNVVGDSRADSHKFRKKQMRSWYISSMLTLWEI